MTAPSPHSPRRQRKALFTATTAQRRRRMSVPLSRELRARFHRRSIPLRKGDTVRVLAGSYVGREERVARVVRRDYSVVLDNVTLKSGEEKLKPLPIRTGHLVITKLNLSDPWRRRQLKVSSEEVTPEERGEPPEESAEPEPVPPSTGPAPAETPDDVASPTPVPAPKPARRASKPAPEKPPEPAVDDDNEDEAEDDSA